MIKKNAVFAPLEVKDIAIRVAIVDDEERASTTLKEYLLRFGGGK